MVLVYLTLLKPEDQGPLEGIEAPGGEAPPITQVERDEQDRERGAKRDREPGAGGADGAGGAGGGGGLQEGDVTAAVGPPAAPGTLRVPSTPSDDQYADAVKSLMENVARGRSSDAESTPAEVARGGSFGP